MKKLSCVIACFFAIAVVAQEKLIIMGTASDKYVLYSADGRESLQTISYLFGISVAKLSAYNNLNASVPLSKGTAIKIPVSLDNLVRQKSDNNATVYHKIRKGDNFYRLSKEYNVPLSLLREWNKMNSDVVKDGQLVMVGFMVNMPAMPNSSVSSNSGAKKSPEIFPPMRVTAPVTKAEKTKETKSLNAPVTAGFYEAERAGKQKEEAKAQAQAAVSAPVTEITLIAEPKESVKPVTKKRDELTDYIPKEGDEGYFAADYAEHSKDQSQQFRSGDAATFKTISGWTDRKFYVLIDDVAPKTIVRITGSGNKSVCAMVLGPLQEIAGGAGLLLRMSNAAASALGFTEAKFTVTLSFFE